MPRIQAAAHDRVGRCSAQRFTGNSAGEPLRATPAYACRLHWA